MITKSLLIAELGSAAAVAEAAGCTRQAVHQWPEIIPVRSAIQLSKTGRWSLQTLRPDVFGLVDEGSLNRRATDQQEPTA